MNYFGRFYLDNEKDIIVELYRESDELYYVLRTPNHNTGNLITNFARLCSLDISYDENGLKVVRGKIPAYIDADNRLMYILRFGNTKVANIFPDGRVELKATIPAVSKTLMSQTKNYRLDEARTIIKTYILNDYKFRSDLHTHMNANLSGDILIALAIRHQIRYPLYYIKKLELRLSERQEAMLRSQREKVAEEYKDSKLKGKYLTRKIDDNTFINFADLILRNIRNSSYNINRIRASLSILKDGQAVFTNLEKVYLYRYVFTKGQPSDYRVKTDNYTSIEDRDIRNYLTQMFEDEKKHSYSLFQDKLLWIARTYQKQGIDYVEISDTTLVKKDAAVKMLKEVHEVMDRITEETGVTIRFLASLRRIPLTLVRDQITASDYLQENLRVLRAVAIDPYIAGSDIVGEEINDIRELEPVIRELTHIANDNPGFSIRIHAGENDGLKDNVENSIRCVEESLLPGQKMPQIRIGHGLFTANLRSEKGRRLMEYMKDNDVVLEFQITSNVRLNNLNQISNHPLKKYLAGGIKCVQGTDGAAIYGTNPIDEQLSLEKLLHLSTDDMGRMKKAETEIVRKSLKNFADKKKRFAELLKGRDIEEYLSERINETEGFISEEVTDNRVESGLLLNDFIQEMPWDKYPVIIAGGSFNNDTHVTRITDGGKKIIRDLLSRLDRNKVFFVIGDGRSGYERYLVDNNSGFDIYAIVPAVISRSEKEYFYKNKLKAVISTEMNRMGLYKSFNYEIFERRESTVIAFDGNSAVLNLIQEARNGKGKAHIFASSHSKSLKNKAESLQGYIRLFGWNDDIVSVIEDIVAQASTQEVQ
ncbi:MAG: adenosine deaminase [Erysipelotrichaceae bacterium]|nr:adenosine deaminase [Erysipelotrichaceae bacterium]